jgi:hypothetical protein
VLRSGRHRTHVVRNSNIITPLGVPQNPLLRHSRFLAQQALSRISQDAKNNLVEFLLARLEVLVGADRVMEVFLLTTGAEQDLDCGVSGYDLVELGIEADLWVSRGSWN